MNEQPRTVGEEWREVRGWVPWLFAGVYFPLYVALDFVAGGSIAAQFGLPRSVSVAASSLGVALLVTVVVTSCRLETISLPETVEALDPRRSVGSRRSTVGSSGGVNRKSVRAPPSTSSTERADGGCSVPGASTDGGTDDGDETDEWPDEWITADEL